MTFPASVRIAIAQMNPIVGDYAGNTRKILSWIDEAEKQKARVIVFPEMALCGYPVWDLANKKSFVDEGLRCLRRIAKATANRKIHILLGFIDRQSGTGPIKSAGPVPASNAPSRCHNAMAWIHHGRVRGVQHKTLLPTYDVFLEEIFFEPARKHGFFACGGLKIGPTICEDIWDEGYAVKPVRLQAQKGARLIVNISASPYYRGVADTREKLLKRHTRQTRRPFLYVNQVGGQDDLVFDGRSFFMDERGQVLFRAPAFEEGLFFFDWAPGTGPSGFAGPAPASNAATVQARFDESRLGSAPVLPADPLNGSPEEMYRALILGVRDYCRKNRFERVLIGLSGGIDSALVAAVAVDALGPQAVAGVTMPSGYSSEGSWKDSEALAANLGIEIRKHAIQDKLDFLLSRYWEHYRHEKKTVPAAGTITLSMENLQARIRGIELMFLSNHEGRLLLSTGNKSELAMGYCTLYGDMAGGLCVLGDIYKTDVYRLARWRNTVRQVIPQAILTKAPSAELRPNQKDQDTLPPYEILDEILRLSIEENKSRQEINQWFKRKRAVPGSRLLGCLAPSEEVIADVLRKVDHNEYKRRQTPPVIRVTRKAWFGRRMPITNRFES